jgi:hypothetical protein
MHDTSSRGYLLEQGPFGLRAVITSTLREDTLRDLGNLPIAELELNDGKGWRGDDLSFLNEFRHLLGFKIIDLNIKSVEPIHALHSLQALDVLTHCKTELRFAQFPDLVECGLEWRPKAMSLFDCVGLKRLYVNRFDGANADPFGRLINLESLTILGSPIVSLEGLSPLAKLRSLRLGDFRKLESLKGIENLIRLEKLEINTCRKIGSIEQIANFVNLRELHLNNLGRIASLKPIGSLHNLWCLTFYESTDILDGDLSPLFGLPNLQKISFQNRRHYSHRREDFGHAYSATRLAD